MAKTYEPIATQTLGSAAASVTFSSIPGTYTDLRLIISGSSSVSDSGIMVRCNGDTGSNYSTTALYGDGTSAVSFRDSNQTRIYIGRHSNVISSSLADFQNYSNATTNKTIISRGNTGSLVIAHVGLWRNTSAITSILIFDQNSYNFTAGSTFTLYGIKAA